MRPYIGRTVGGTTATSTLTTYNEARDYAPHGATMSACLLGNIITT